MNLSKSKYCEAIQCNKLLWMDTFMNEEAKEVKNSSTLDNGVEVGVCARDLFGPHINIDYDTNLNVMIENTKKALKRENVVITEASFLYKNNFCSVDILKKDSSDIEIYEVKSSTEIKDIYLDDVSYQTYILLNLGYNIKKVCIVYLNNKYYRNGDLDLNKLFIIKDVTKQAFDNQVKVQDKTQEIENYMKSKNEPVEKIGKQCSQPYDCPFFEYCTRTLPQNNVFKIRGMQIGTKLKFYEQGKYDFNALLTEDMNWKYKQQIEFEVLDKEPIIDKKKIKEMLDKLSYPLYFLDFETYQQPIPKYDGINPYAQIPFQYSLHYIEKDGGELMHKEFLGEAGLDPRRKLAESLVNDIPENVCTLAYNMKFEKMIIRYLANLYPDLEKHLMNIHDNMQDLMPPFQNRDYYTKEMKGSFSIKYVLPALFPDDESLDYHNLELIHNGTEAMSTFAILETLSKEEQEIMRNNLLKYCELDTYAMVKIWQKLKSITEEVNS